MANFFDYIPDRYIGVEKTTNYLEEYSVAYVRVKNFFRASAKIRPDMSKYVTLFTPYIIDPGMRPDNVAYELYRDPKLDWTLCITNNIVDPYIDWPKDPGQELLRYVHELYGEGNEVEVHHYETREFKDDDGNVILKGGITVNPDATFINPYTKEALINAVVPISNYEYESFENEKKRFIYALSPLLIDDFLQEFEELTAYLRNTEQDDFDIPKTELKPLNRFLQNSSGVSISPSFGKYKNFIAAAQSVKAYLEQEETTTTTTAASSYSGNITFTGTSSTVLGTFNPTQSDAGTSNVGYTY